MPAKPQALDRSTLRSKPLISCGIIQVTIREDHNGAGRDGRGRLTKRIRRLAKGIRRLFNPLKARTGEGAVVGS